MTFSVEGVLHDARSARIAAELCASGIAEYLKNLRPMRLAHTTVLLAPRERPEPEVLYVPPQPNTVVELLRAIDNSRRKAAKKRMTFGRGQLKLR